MICIEILSSQRELEIEVLEKKVGFEKNVHLNTMLNTIHLVLDY